MTLNHGRSGLTDNRRLGKGYKGMGMEGVVAKWYARITYKDIAELRLLAERLSREIEPRSFVLEVAPGPGYLSIELAKHNGLRLTGLDISRSFVEMAGKKAREGDVPVDFQIGNASDMPFDDESFDFIVCRAAFKNFSEPVSALNEFHRVLKTKGRALIIDLRRDVSGESIEGCVSGMGLSPVNAFLTKLIFKHTLIKRAYTIDQMKELVGATHFSDHIVAETLTGFELWLSK